MEEANRESLIKELAKGFETLENEDLQLKRSDYIEETNSLNCSIDAIDKEDLKKTLRVIKQHEQKFRNNAVKSPTAMQYVYHLEIAKKCVEEIITQKKQSNS